MTADVVTYQVPRPGVALLTFNRPDRLNAWSPELGSAYGAALDRAGADPDVRAVVVTGAGRGWCAGADLDLLAGVAGGGPRAGASDRPHQRYETSVPKPVIAAVNGACAGLGLVHAAYCDVRFAAAGAKFTTAFVRRGLVAEHGMSSVLPRLMGFGNAMDVLLSGRVFLAEEAAAMGFVNRVVPPEALLDTTLDYAAELATWCSPAAMRDIKRQLWDDGAAALDDVVARANALMTASFGRPDLTEGVSSYTERRAPQFPPV